MPRTLFRMGEKFTFPDDATDEEVNSNIEAWAAENKVNPIVEGITRASEDYLAKPVNQIGSIIGSTFGLDTSMFDKPLEDIKKRQKRIGERMTLGEEILTGGVSAAAGSLGLAGAGMLRGAGMLLRGAAGREAAMGAFGTATTLGGGITGLDTYTESREAGLSVPRSIFHAAIDAAIEKYTEYLPGAKLLESGGRPFWREIGKFVGRDLTGEEIATVTQDLNAMLSYNPDMTLGDIARDMVVTAGVSAIASPLAGGIIRGGQAVAEAIRPSPQDGGAVDPAAASTPPPAPGTPPTAPGEVPGGPTNVNVEATQPQAGQPRTAADLLQSQLQKKTETAAGASVPAFVVKPEGMELPDQVIATTSKQEAEDLKTKLGGKAEILEVATSIEDVQKGKETLGVHEALKKQVTSPNQFLLSKEKVGLPPVTATPPAAAEGGAPQNPAATPEEPPQERTIGMRFGRQKTRKVVFASPEDKSAYQALAELKRFYTGRIPSGLQQATVERFQQAIAAVQARFGEPEWGVALKSLEIWGDSVLDRVKNAPAGTNIEIAPLTQEEFDLARQNFTKRQQGQGGRTEQMQMDPDAKDVGGYVEIGGEVEATDYLKQIQTLVGKWAKIFVPNAKIIIVGESNKIGVMGSVLPTGEHTYELTVAPQAMGKFRVWANLAHEFGHIVFSEAVNNPLMASKIAAMKMEWRAIVAQVPNMTAQDFIRAYMGLTQNAKILSEIEALGLPADISAEEFIKARDAQFAKIFTAARGEEKYLRWLAAHGSYTLDFDEFMADRVQVYMTKKGHALVPQELHGYFDSIVNSMKEFFEKVVKKLGVSKSLEDFMGTMSTLGQLQNQQEIKDTRKKEDFQELLQLNLSSGETIQYTTKVLNRLPGKTSLKKETVMAEMKRSDIRQRERDLILDVLKEFPGPTVPANDFKARVLEHLIPTTEVESKTYATFGLDSDMHLDRGKARSVIVEWPYEVPSMWNPHFGSDSSRYFYHYRAAPEIKQNASILEEPTGPEGTTLHILEVQSDWTLSQTDKDRIEEAKKVPETGKEVIDQIVEFWLPGIDVGFFKTPQQIEYMIAAGLLQASPYSLGISSDLAALSELDNIKTFHADLVGEISELHNFLKSGRIPYVTSGRTLEILPGLEGKGFKYNTPLYEWFYRKSTPESGTIPWWAQSMKSSSGLHGLTWDQVQSYLETKYGFAAVDSLFEDVLVFAEERLGRNKEQAELVQFADFLESVQDFLPKNWYEFAARGIVARAQKEGRKAVRFPDTYTVAWIEGHWRLYEGILSTTSSPRNGGEAGAETPQQAVEDMIAESQRAAAEEARKNDPNYNETEELAIDESLSYELKRAKQTTFGVWNFYSKSLIPFLRKEFGATKVRGYNGFEWWEVSLENRDGLNIEYFQIDTTVNDAIDKLPGRSGFSPGAMRFRGFLKSTLQINQMTKLWGDKVPGLRAFRDVMRDMAQMKNSLMMGPNKRIVEWYKLGRRGGKGVEQLLLDEVGNQIHFTNLVQLPTGKWVHQPSKALGIEVKKRQLTDKQVAVYLGVKNDFLEVLQTMQQVLEKSVRTYFANNPVQAAIRIREIQEEFKKFREKPYLPDRGFGKFSVMVHAKKDMILATGEKISAGDLLYWRKHENEWAQKREWKKMVSALGNNDFTTSMHQMEDLPFVLRGIPKSFVATLAEGLQLDQKQIEALQQLNYDATKEGAFFKLLEKGKKNIGGASNDIRRVYADYFWRTANLVAKMNYSQDAYSAVAKVHSQANEARKAGGDSAMLDTIHERLRQKIEYVMHPQNEWEQFRMWVSLWYLWGVPKSALMNFVSVPTVGWAHLAAKYGDTKATAQMVKTMATIRRAYQDPEKSSLDPDSLKALQRALEDGTLDQSFAAELAAVSDGNAVERILPYSDWMQDSQAADSVRQAAWKTIYFGMLPFRAMEGINRRVMLLAAFQLAKSKNMSFEEAYISARDAVDYTQNDYSAWNKPAFLEGKQSSLLIFFSYVQNMAFFMYGGDKGWWRAMIMVAILGGLQGLPGSENLIDMLNWVWRKFSGEHNDLRLEARKLGNELTGGYGDMVMHGLSSNVPFLGWDVSGSVGMGRIIPGTDAVFGIGDFETRFVRMASEAGGPAGSLMISGLQAMADESSPTALARFERVLPAAARNLYRAGKTASEGRMQTPKGDILVEDPTAAEIAGQALGFQPARKGDAQEKRRFENEVVQYYQLRRQNLLSGLWMAKQTGDLEVVKNAEDAIARYNSQVKDFRLKITAKDKAESWKQRLRDQKFPDLKDRRYRGAREEVGRTFQE